MLCPLFEVFEYFLYNKFLLSFCFIVLVYAQWLQRIFIFCTLWRGSGDGGTRAKKSKGKGTGIFCCIWSGLLENISMVMVNAVSTEHTF